MENKRPLGMTIILVYYLFSLIAILLMGFLSLSTLKTHITYILWFRIEGIFWLYLLRVIFLVVTLSLVYGIWKRKKYTPYVMYSYNGYIILTYLFYMGLILFFPESYFQTVKRIGDIPQGFLMSMRIISATISMIKISIPALIIWYIYKHKLFFSEGDKENGLLHSEKVNVQ